MIFNRKQCVELNIIENEWKCFIVRHKVVARWVIAFTLQHIS